MFFKSFAVPFASPFRAADAVRPVAAVFRAGLSLRGGKWSTRMTGAAIQAHLLVAPARGATTGFVGNADSIRASQSRRRVAVRQLHRAGLMALRAALRAAFAGRPLTPAGYAILAAMVTAVALVALFSASSAGAELDSALWLGGWCC